MRFAAIAGWADSDAYPVSFMCAWLGVSRSGYYAWRGAEPSQRSKDDSALIAVMKKIHEQARGNPGVRRMRAGLAALGQLVSHKRVHRLMQAAGLRGRHPKAWKRTTIGGDQPVPAPDLIGRDFTAALPDMRWCGDVTYIKTWDGWAYLATVIDLYSRKVVGWAVARAYAEPSAGIGSVSAACRRDHASRPAASVKVTACKCSSSTDNSPARYCRVISIASRWLMPPYPMDATRINPYSTLHRAAAHLKPPPSLQTT